MNHTQIKNKKVVFYFGKNFILLNSYIMIYKLRQILIILLSNFILVGQFKADLPIKKSSENSSFIPNSEDSFYNRENSNLNFNHSISISMLSSNNQLLSIAGFNNSLAYTLNKNLTLNANITLSQIKNPFKQGSLNNQLDLSYSATLLYKPFRNSVFEISMHRMPYYRYNQVTSPLNTEFYK